MAKLDPSLLESESRGGDIAEGGFAFQEQVALAYIPTWLAKEGFSSVIREAMGDIEAKFFVPGYGEVRELLEVKNHRIAPAEFWKEIGRFQQLYNSSPKDWAWFTFACTGLSDVIEPLVNGLRRIRDPYSFYDENSPIIASSFAEYKKIIFGISGNDNDADFLFKKVLIDSNLNEAKINRGALFVDSINTSLPQYRDVSLRLLNELCMGVLNLVKKNRAREIFRSEIESEFLKYIPQQFFSLSPSITMETLAQYTEDYRNNNVRFDWVDFFGGDNRNYPPQSEWNQRLIKQLRQTREWMLKYRSNVKRIKLIGDRRLSASIAIGSEFSAVTGFNIDMLYRNQTWSTDEHATASDSTYDFSCQLSGKEKGDSLVVVIDIMRKILDQVNSSLVQHNLADSPILYIHGDNPITSGHQANWFAWEIKKIIYESLAQVGARDIQLFYAGPAHLALFLGHRFNAVVPIQCYEYIAPGRYVQVCKLFV